jgi:integrative and conjugative element protein (TIGR02256 family)
MALNLRAIWRPKSDLNWHAQFPASSQRVVIDPIVQRHTGRYRQTKPWASEAGGQLFGTVNADVVHIRSANGPHNSDIRSRYSFRSDPHAAQRAINAHARHGMFYLGEWHTHAQDSPKPSASDFDAIRSIWCRSQLNATGILLMIVGRIPGPEGVALCCQLPTGWVELTWTPLPR